MARQNISRNQMLDRASRNHRNATSRRMATLYSRNLATRHYAGEDPFPWAFLLGFAAGNGLIVLMVALFAREISDFLWKLW